LLNTILGSFSSGVAASTNSYESIATVTVGSGGSATVEFTSIPATYTHLQVRVLQKSDSAGDLNFKFNSDGGSNYSRHYLYGDGSTAASGGVASQTLGYIGYNPSSTIFQASVIDILDYTNTNKYKTVRSLVGTDTNGGGYVIFSSSLWLSTSAITTISFNQGNNTISQYSSFALYGIKGV
jgi:hypothetical protein